MKLNYSNETNRICIQKIKDDPLLFVHILPLGIVKLKKPVCAKYFCHCSMVSGRKDFGVLGDIWLTLQSPEHGEVLEFMVLSTNGECVVV